MPEARSLSAEPAEARMDLETIARFSAATSFAPDMHLIAGLGQSACDAARVVAHAASLGKVFRRDDVNDACHNSSYALRQRCTTCDH